MKMNEIILANLKGITLTINAEYIEPQGYEYSEDERVRWEYNLYESDGSNVESSRWFISYHDCLNEAIREFEAYIVKHKGQYRN